MSSIAADRLALAERAIAELRRNQKRGADEAGRTRTLVIERAAEVEAPTPYDVLRVLEGDPAQPATMHVNDLLLANDVNLIAAPGGKGKTTIMLHVAVCTVLGRPVFGTLAVPRPGPVLVLAPEDGQAAVRMMLDSIIEGLGLDASDRATLRDYIGMIPEAEVVDLRRDLPRLARTMIDAEAVLLVADPLRNLIGDAVERDEAVAGHICAQLRHWICREADATVWLSHHARKAGRDPVSENGPTADDVRGSGGWVNGARLVFAVAKRDDRITLTSVKSNRIRADLRHQLDLTVDADPDNPARWISCRLEDANAGARSETFTPGVGRPLNDNEMKALGVLDDRLEPGARFSYSRWFKESGIGSENTFRGVKDRLLGTGLAGAEATDRMNRNRKSPIYQYGITDRGRRTLISGGWTPQGVKG